MSDVNDDLNTQEPMDVEATADDDASAEPEVVAETSPRLVAMDNGEETDLAFPLPEKGTIGRFDPGVGPIEVDLSEAPDSSYVSRRHAEVSCEDGVWKIRDLGSSNGLFVMRDTWERVEEAELTDGTQLALGNAKFVFREG
ncbi:MAG: FHA domain-containing protein [Fimbriimonadaceae bacterium]